MTDISQTILTRKGARKGSELAQNVLVLLNEGKIESVNLVEWQAVHHPTLLKHVLPTQVTAEELAAMSSELTAQKAETGLKAIRLIGQQLHQIMKDQSLHKQEALLAFCSKHTSDSVRCWAAFLHQLQHHSLEEKLAYIYPFAADHHFGVREIAWMSVRQNLADEMDRSIALLTKWAQSDDENIRRFSSEVIRPRGVWTKHIDLLKQQPEKAAPILEHLKSDPSTYVQDSVGNWLNDASKTQPEWVLHLCERWDKESKTKATARIIKKAKRTIEK
ncbi:DNA alkylation repair protein [Bacillaceae bacterium SIJ1]|uniref:DNA alkylation repair protein n=1 Tax=Litoribacterium kuwaitense TaxID=1398745 RepID=UPI0013EC58BA|nr:DNA alkylation repair protein [Litoribacterium kuwaitense]NGP45234.1 DNA alkylation repair protein [Litoribacterium kuwaitense]